MKVVEVDAIVKKEYDKTIGETTVQITPNGEHKNIIKLEYNEITGKMLVYTEE